MYSSVCKDIPENPMYSSVSKNIPENQVYSFVYKNLLKNQDRRLPEVRGSKHRNHLRSSHVPENQPEIKEENIFKKLEISTFNKKIQFLLMDR